MGTEQATKSATLAPAPSNVIHVAFGNNRRRAYDAYVKGSALDENPATALEAEAAYKEALRLDPRLDLAYTNLGNLRYRAGDERGAEARLHGARAGDHGRQRGQHHVDAERVHRGQRRHHRDELGHRQAVLGAIDRGGDGRVHEHPWENGAA